MGLMLAMSHPYSGGLELEKIIQMYIKTAIIIMDLWGFTVLT